MSIEIHGAFALDEPPCRYGRSRLQCRGPLRRPEPPYFAFLGESETYGKYVKRPFAALLERDIGQVCINLGATNAGVDAYLGDDTLLEIAAGATQVVIQAMGAQNLTNRYYRVHPRRNDRFVAPEPALRQLFPEVDFTEIHFTRHLLAVLAGVSHRRYLSVAAELRQTWQERMSALLGILPRPPVLLWLRYDPGGGAWPEPVLVGQEMVVALAPALARVIEVPAEPAAVAGEMNAMIYAPAQAAAAGRMIGQGAHYKIAEALAAALPQAPESKRPA